MDVVLVFLLILVVLSAGQSSDDSKLCNSKCPAGYSIKKGCDNRAGYFECQECEKGTYTAIANTAKKCKRCKTCGRYEVIIRPCSSTNNTECGCNEGHYLEGPNTDSGYCIKCDCQYCKGPDANRDGQQYVKKCQPCQRACAETPVPPPPPSTTTTTPTTSPGTITQNPEIVSKAEKPMPVWLSVLVPVGISVVLCGLLLLLHLIWKKNKNPNIVLCCRTNIEQGGDPGSSSTTLRFNIAEESPMMDLSHCPASPRHPAAYTHPLLPTVEQAAARQEEQSEHWPAIFLYAIIKEVPLRRWKEFLRLLLVADQQLERVELEAGLGSIEKQYQMLRLWSQRSSATLSDVVSALHHMDLSGCAQLLQENLEKLQVDPSTKV